MFDPYQVSSISMQCEKKKKNKIKKVYISALVGMIVAVAGIYIANIIFNILEKRKFNEIFKVTSTWQLYYASIIAGGINGILSVLLPPKLYRFASVIIITIVYEVIAGLTGQTTLDNMGLVRALVRDIFLIFFIIDLYKKLFKDYTKKDKKSNKEDDENIEINELLNVTLLSSIVLNIGIITTKTGINSILGL
ncbi:MAG: hypothetical protein IJB21_07420 [Bacilli bacterium]|nr:hypothetical protein [Bacilli bacterium]